MVTNQPSLSRTESLAGCKIFSAKIQDSPSRLGWLVTRVWTEQRVNSGSSLYQLCALGQIIKFAEPFPPSFVKIGFKNPILESYYEDPQMHIPRILGTVQQVFWFCFYKCLYLVNAEAE